MNPLFPALMASAFILSASGELMPTSAEVFGGKYASLDNRATSDWWTRQGPQRKNRKAMINLDVPRDKVIGFAIYTLEGSSLKMTAQLFPLKPDESQEIRLELKKATPGRKSPNKKSSILAGPLTFALTIGMEPKTMLIGSVTPKKPPLKARSDASPPTRKPLSSGTSPATHPALPGPALLS